MDHLSASQVQTYLGCPLKYRFQYVDKIPRPWRAAALAFGTSIHAAIEWFQRERMAGRTPDVARAVSIFEADWFAQNLEVLVFPDKESRESHKEKGVRMLPAYLETLGPALPVAIEEPFEVDLYDPETGEDLGVRVKGFVDLVEEGNVLADVKTAGRALENGGLERHLQLSIYALAFLLLHGSIPRLRLDMIMKTKVPRVDRLETERSLPDLAWTARLIARTARAIERGNFFPNPSWRCSECEYFANCQAWRG
jgi:putative RecB family exonuclease